MFWMKHQSCLFNMNFKHVVFKSCILLRRCNKKCIFPFRSKAQVADLLRHIICQLKTQVDHPLLYVHLCLNLSKRHHRRGNQPSSKCEHSRSLRYLMDNFCLCQKFYTLNIQLYSLLHLFVYDFISNLLLPVYQN